MPTCIALLRGINVGQAKRVPMETLRQLLAGLGCTHVHTLLNSGNAVFQAPGRPGAALARAIEQALADQLGLAVPVIVKTARQLASIVAESPFAPGSADASRQIVAFAPDAASLATLQRIAPLVQPPDTLVIGQHAAYLHCPQGVLASPAGAALLGPAGQAATTRNWATTLKLQALCARSGA